MDSCTAVAVMTGTLRERRCPTGLTTWGPLPGTGIMHIMWMSPGSGLFLVLGQPDTPGAPLTRIGMPAPAGAMAPAPGHAGGPCLHRCGQRARLTRPRKDEAPRWLITSWRGASPVLSSQ